MHVRVRAENSVMLFWSLFKFIQLQWTAYKFHFDKIIIFKVQREWPGYYEEDEIIIQHEQEWNFLMISTEKSETMNVFKNFQFCGFYAMNMLNWKDLSDYFPLLS